MISLSLIHKKIDWESVFLGFPIYFCFSALCHLCTLLSTSSFETHVLPVFLLYSSIWYCADAGYGSEEDYELLQTNRIQAFVKYNYFHKERQRPFQKEIFRIESFFYNPKKDYYVCPMGKTHGLHWNQNQCERVWI